MPKGSTCSLLRVLVRSSMKPNLIITNGLSQGAIARISQIFSWRKLHRCKNHLHPNIANLTFDIFATRLFRDPQLQFADCLENISQEILWQVLRDTTRLVKTYKVTSNYRVKLRTFNQEFCTLIRMVVFPYISRDLQGVSSTQIQI